MKWWISSLAVLIGCGSPEAIYEAPSFTPPEQRFVPCDASTPCPSGMFCDQDICKAGTGPGTGGGTTGGGTGQPNIPDAGPAQPQDVFQPAFDPGPTVTQDAGPPDTGPAPDPGPSEPDECPVPGSDDGCGATPQGWTTCRLDPDGVLRCSGFTTPNPYGTPCIDHTQCDPLYACHHGLCTRYCQLPAGACMPLQDGTPTTCQSFGHPTWGGCKP